MKAQRSDSLWPLSFDQESGDMGVGRLSDNFSNHKYFPWHKVNQARTSAPTGVILEWKPSVATTFGHFLLIKKVAAGWPPLASTLVMVKKAKAGAPLNLG